MSPGKYLVWLGALNSDLRINPGSSTWKLRPVVKIFDLAAPQNFIKHDDDNTSLKGL